MWKQAEADGALTDLGKRLGPDEHDEDHEGELPARLWRAWDQQARLRQRDGGGHRRAHGAGATRHRPFARPVGGGGRRGRQTASGGGGDVGGRPRGRFRRVLRQVADRHRSGARQRGGIPTRTGTLSGGQARRRAGRHQPLHALFPQAGAGHRSGDRSERSAVPHLPGEPRVPGHHERPGGERQGQRGARRSCRQGSGAGGHGAALHAALPR